MSVKTSGMHRIVKDIEAKYGEVRMVKAQDKALKRASKYFASQLKTNFEIFRDTGASIQEINVTDPYFIHGNVRMVKVHWEGPKHRYAIIHINEYGTVRNPNPRGKGAIARTMVQCEKPIKQIIRETLEGEL